MARKILTLHEVNYGESAQICVNMRSYVNTCNITHIHVDMHTWLIKHGHITCIMWPVKFLTHSNAIMAKQHKFV